MIEERCGVLVIAHGSSRSKWVEQVDQAMGQVEIGEMPIVTTYLEMVDGRTIVDGIHTLESQGVTKILIVPLFVSSGSTHIEEIRYLFGLLHRKPRIKIDKEPFQLRSTVFMCQPMDDHPLITRRLIQHAQEMSVDPANEALLLIGHGSEQEEYREKWKSGMESLVRQLHQEIAFAKVTFATIQPDNLRQHLGLLSKEYRVLLLPLFLSEGYFTRKVIPSKVEGLNYVYTGRTYLPSPLISRWVETVVKEYQKWGSACQVLPTLKG